MQKLTNSITWFHCNRQRRGTLTAYEKTNLRHEMEACKQALCARFVGLRMRHLTLAAGVDCSLYILCKRDIIAALLLSLA